MSELTEFEKEYFIETRKEIDTEKRERDQMLNFAIVVVAAVGFGISQSETAQKFVQKPEALALEIPALAIISTLFWIRYKKLRQISDRWFTLYYMALEHFGEDRIHRMLEQVAVDGLKDRRYIIKDVILNIALSLPFYGLLVLQSLNAYSLGQHLRIILAIASIVLHLCISTLVLSRKLPDPFAK